MLNLAGILKTKKRMSDIASIDDLSAQDIVVVVMGPTGSGKSSFIQMATGREGGVGHSLESCTTEISVIKHILPELADSNIYFVDTPGFNNSDPVLSDETIGTMVSDLLSSLSKKKIRLTALLYFHRISENRFTGSNFRNLYHFKGVCKDHLDNAVLITTMWGETDETTGCDRENELITMYWKTIVRPQESIVKQFLHHPDSAIELLSPLVEKRNDVLLQEHMKVISTSWQTPDGLSGFQNLVARQQEVKKKIRDELRAPTELMKFLGLLDAYHKLSADLESAIEMVKEENFPFGGWLQESIVEVEWGRYLRTFVSKEARRKSGNLGYEPRTNGNLSNDSLVTWRGDTGLIHTVKTNKSGAVESGTLESLVRILIENFGASGYADYCNTFLQTCYELKSRPKDDLDVFLLICKRFSEAENEQDDDKRIVTQYSTLLVIERWFKLGSFNPSEAAISRLEVLFDEATKMNSTSLLKDRAQTLLQLLKGQNSNLPRRSHRRRGPATSNPTPEGVAIALTLLEGDLFKAIRPSDYIQHLTRPSSANPSIERYQRTNDMVKTWVIDSILRYTDVMDRLHRMNFFVKTALACIEKGNFSSSTAIASALESPAIRDLELTKRSLPTDSAGRLATFRTILDPESKHHCYWAAIHDPRKDVHVPCLPIYLKELGRILRQYTMTVGKVDGQYLINFKRYIAFMHCIQDHLRFTPLNMNDQRYSGELEYLLDRLRGIDISEEANKRRVERSRTLMAQEKVDHRSRKVQLRQLGFA